MWAPSCDPFVIQVTDEVLDDLKIRLSRPRFSVGYPPEDWSYGTDGAYLRQLIEYWREEYDWRVHERTINRFHHYRTELDDTPIHFIAEPGAGPAPIPLIMTHGWPWTFWDLRKVIGPLADPAAHGGDPEDAFHVIVPSLPGFGFSTPLKKAGLNFWTTADLWHKLMTEVLGFDRFAAQGGDWGAYISAQLGHKYASSLIGLHIHLMAALEPSLPGGDFAEDEKEWAERNAAHYASGIGYAAIQMTKPASLGYGLDDSPVALASWMLEKRRDWSDSDGDIEARFSKDDLCTMLTIYWVTCSGASAARFYGEYARNPWAPSHDRNPRVEAPTAIAAFPRELFKAPRAWAESYYNLRRYTAMPRGGHFASAEEPELLIEDIRAFFRTLR